MVCKRKSSAYRATERPSPYWIKVENPRYSQAEGREELFDRDPVRHVSLPLIQKGSFVSIDRNANIRCQVFQQQGCETILARDGREAIAQAAKYVPDLIVMDIQMPLMDGCEATRRIHSIPYLSKVPVVAMSAHWDGERIRRAFDAGCVECVAKPVELDKIEQLGQRYVQDCA